MSFKPVSLGVVVALLLTALVTVARADALARLTPEKLQAVHRAIGELKNQWQALPRQGPHHEFRANLHVHSALSHDSRGKIEDIVAAAKRVGTRVLMFTEHPSDRYDYFKDGHQGLRDGVLLIPGAETDGFLAFPTQSFQGVGARSPQEFADLLTGRGGLLFLSHLEERMTWNIRGLTGTEIYNIHANFKDEKKLQAALRSPPWIFKIASLVRQYPQEVFSALQAYPADYLRRWDQLCRDGPITGVAANDAHQNVGLTVRLRNGESARIEDALGETLFDIKLGVIPTLESLSRGKSPGEILFRIQFDRYENSLRHVGTHLLLVDLSNQSVWESLRAGRAFVAFDWLADATGFDFAAMSATARHDMGSQPEFSDGMKLRAQSPLPVHWKVIRNGRLLGESTGRELVRPVLEAGNYRVEAWLNLAGEEMIWILSNRIYIRRAGKARSSGHLPTPWGGDKQTAGY
jgi:hypothetical protein